MKAMFDGLSSMYTTRKAATVALESAAGMAPGTGVCDGLARPRTYSGSSTQNSEPLPGVLSKPTAPPISSASRRVIESPIPVPSIGPAS